MEMKEVNLDKPVYDKLAKAAKEKGWKKPEDYLTDLILTRTDSRISIEPDVLTVLERASIQLGISEDKIASYATLCMLEFDGNFVAVASLLSGRRIKERDKLDHWRETAEAEIKAAFEKWKESNLAKT